MKKTLRILFVLVLVLTALSLFACNGTDPNVTTEDNLFAFTVDSKAYAITDTTTVTDYMNMLAQDGKVTFTFDDGMISEINGKAQALNCYWYLYTDDAEMINPAWKSYKYDEKTYGSASAGAGTLVVKDGCTYIWVYKSSK